MSSKMVTVKYVCSKCGAEDNPRFYMNENPPPVINCWSCHAGFQMDIAQQLQSNRGMFAQAKVA